MASPFFDTRCARIVGFAAEAIGATCSNMALALYAAYAQSRCHIADAELIAAPLNAYPPAEGWPHLYN